ncbi:MAG TPA: cation diffusion facilitator family transporter [Clostridia bacterium]|nr:cation diffusion facilitator family transporter [Clostridia bacterium]
MDRNRQIKIASWIGITGNMALSSAKILIGVLSGSMAVIGDGIDSATDIVMSLITLFAAAIMARPPDPEHPYGYGRAETVATKLLSFMIFFAGAQFMISTVSRFQRIETLQKPDISAVYVILASVAGKLVLSRVQHYMAKKSGSAMISAIAKNMQNDILISLAVLFGLAFTFVMDMPIMDLVTAFGISIWVMKSALSIFLETSSEVMEETKDLSIYDTLFEIVSRVEGANHPHRTRVRKFGDLLYIDMDIEVNGDLKVKEAHLIAHELERKIHDEIEEVYDIMVHIEPLGCTMKDEKFGLSQEIINKTKIDKGGR